MKQISISYHSSPCGELILGSLEGKLCLCDWRFRKMRSTIDSRIKNHLNSEYKEQTSATIEQTKTQLNEYFKNERKEFDIPLSFAGTDFQKEVWKNLIAIPFGKTLSYLELSHQMNNPKAIRAVASANGANAISILVPCHRIIGSKRELTGYAGGLTAKKKLLELENSFHKDQLNLF